LVGLYSLSSRTVIGEDRLMEFTEETKKRMFSFTEKEPKYLNRKKVIVFKKVIKIGKMSVNGLDCYNGLKETANDC
jgi:hypothetical protein